MDLFDMKKILKKKPRQPGRVVWDLTLLPDQDSNLDSTDSESDVLASYTIGQ
jgi:hypothetical protein